MRFSIVHSKEVKTISYIKHPKHVPFEYSRITDYIYLGTNQCCQVHFKKQLLAKGVKADISLEEEHLDAPFGVDYFLWLPVKDKNAPTQKQLLIGARTIQDLVDNKVKVYVHCKRGHGRSPCMVAAYLMLTGKSAKDAITYVRKRRAIHMTLPQIKALKSFEKTVHKQCDTMRSSI